jgi:integrase
MQSRTFRFDEKKIAALRPHSRDSRSAVGEFTDLEIPALKCAITRTGKKHFWARVSVNGKRKMLTLGSTICMSVAEAREKAVECMKMASQGLDPTDARNQRKTIYTLSEFATDEYMPYAMQTKRSWKDDESRLRREIGQMLGHIPITEVTTRDVMQLHAAIFKKNSAATANRYLSLVSRLFSFAIQIGYASSNPVKNIKKYKENGPRQRILCGTELTRFMQCLEESEQNTAVLAIRLSLQTGLRSKSELFSLPWSCVDFENGTVKLMHTKNGRVRTIAINTVALSLLKEMHSKADPLCPWVFPARVGTGHLVDIRKPLNKILAKAGITGVTPHDLRRSFGSLLCNAGVDIYQIKDLLGHSNVTVTQRAYAHLQQSTLRTSCEVVARTLEEALGKAA